MIHKLGTTQLRKRLRDYLYDTSTLGHMYQIMAEDCPALILSPETLAALQKRYLVNTLFQQGYEALSLHRYMTLTEGEMTNELPLDTIIALSKVFQLLQDLTRILARPGAKENALKWNVSKQLLAASDDHTYNPGGEFEEVTVIASTIFSPAEFSGCETLLSFFRQVSFLSSDTSHIKLEHLSPEQRDVVLEILKNSADWAAELLEYQTISVNQGPERVLLKFVDILSWYEENVTRLPELTKQCQQIISNF